MNFAFKCNFFLISELFLFTNKEGKQFCVRLFATLWSVAHRLLCPWDSPGKNTRVSCQFFLQGIFPTQGSNPGLLHCRQILYQMSYLGSTSIKRENKFCIESWGFTTSISLNNLYSFLVINYKGKKRNKKRNIAQKNQKAVNWQLGWENLFW